MNDDVLRDDEGKAIYPEGMEEAGIKVDVRHRKGTTFINQYCGKCGAWIEHEMIPNAATALFMRKLWNGYKLLCTVIATLLGVNWLAQRF